MKSFGLTMAFAILVSMVVSFTLTPMMSARWLKRSRAPAAKGEAKGEGDASGAHGAGHGSKESRVFGALDRGYGRLVGWSLRHRAW